MYAIRSYYAFLTQAVRLDPGQRTNERRLAVVDMPDDTDREGIVHFSAARIWWPCETPRMAITNGTGQMMRKAACRITSYNVCYTKLLRVPQGEHPAPDRRYAILL